MKIYKKYDILPKIEEWKEKILFIEDIGESIYRLDRMLTQLALAGKFDDCVGIVFGDFCDCNKDNDDDFEILELIQDRVGKYNKPCIFNLKSGHCTPMITLPFGCKYKLNATEKIAHLDESVKSAHKRIDGIEKLTQSVYELAASIKTMQTSIINMSDRLKTVEEKPSKRWDLIVTSGITAIVGGLIGYILFKLGLGG